MNTYKHADRHTGQQVDRHANRQVDKQTYTHDLQLQSFIHCHYCCIC